MRWLRFFHYSFYRSLLIYFVVLIAFTVALLSIILYLFFTKSTEGEINRISQLLLTQTSYTSNIVQRQVVNIGLQMLNENEFVNVMFGNEIDRVQEYYAKTGLNRIQAMYPFVQYMGVYNVLTDRYISTVDFSFQIDPEIKRLIIENTELQNLVVIPRTVYHVNHWTEPVNVITFVMMTRSSTAFQSTGAIVIDIAESYILNTIHQMGKQAQDPIFVMNHEGIVLSHTDDSQFMKQINELPYIQKMIDNNDTQGYFIDRVGNKKQLISYVKSEELDWYFVSMKPRSEIASNTVKLRNYTIIIGFCILLIGMILAIISSNTIYNPIGNLLKRITAFKSPNNPSTQSQNEFKLLTEAFSNAVHAVSDAHKQIEMSFPIYKKIYLTSLLKGTVHDNLDHHELYHSFKNELKDTYFCVLLLKIDRFSVVQQKESLNKQALYRFAICNIAQEIIARHLKNNAITLEEDTVAVVIQSHRPGLWSNYHLSLTELQQVIHNYFQLSISISIGAFAAAPEQLSASYQSALNLMKYRLFYGEGSIIEESTIKRRLSQTVDYPSTAEKKILEALLITNLEQITKGIDQFIVVVKKATYEQAMLFCNQLLITVLKRYSGTMQLMEADDAQFYQMILAIPHCETIEQIRDEIQSFCFQLCQVIDMKKSMKNNKIIEEIHQYIQENYDDANISLEQISDKVRLSPGYVGKLFRSLSNTSFSDYLKNVRMNKAKQLLIETSLTTSEIAERVGIHNTTYFYTLFKKTYGMSPTQFRKTQLQQQSDAIHR